MAHKSSIGFDMDGVVARFFEGEKKPTGLFDLYNPGHGTDYSDETMTSPQLIDVFPEPIVEVMYDIFNAPGFYAQLDEYKEGIAVVNKLIDMGLDVEIVTSPSNHYIDKTLKTKAINPHSAHGKIDWIVEHIPRLGKHITITKKKWRFKVDRLVEDTPKNLDEWCEEHPNGLGILIDRPWNQGWTPPANAVRTTLGGILQYI